jgi:arylsulfatase A-like enzyme
VAEPVQLVDVMPTILEIAGIDASGLLLQGRSLLPLAEGREATPRLALSEEVTNFHGEEGPEVWASLFFGQRHVLRTKSLGSTVVFDLEVDPREEDAGRAGPAELLESSEQLMRKMKETNVAIRLALMRGGAQSIQTSTEDQERLKALGYIQ